MLTFLFPQRRRLTASCQMFLQSMNNSLLAGTIAPAVWGSTLSLSLHHRLSAGRRN